MKRASLFFAIILSFALAGCDGTSIFLPPPWHFDGGTDGQAPQPFIDQANQDFDTIMPAYRAEGYPDAFDNRFAAGPYTNQTDQFWRNGDHGFSVRSYFDPQLRYQEEADEYKRYAALPPPTGMAVAVLGWQRLPPPEAWAQGYFTAKSQANFARLFPQTWGANLLTAVLSINAAMGAGQSQKMYGFVWENDFTKAERHVDACPVGISFTFTWRRTVSVPVDVS